jgi:arylsulfatase A-like enzyme
MIRLTIFAASLMASALTMFAGPLAAQEGPSILVISGDDIGWISVSSYGGDIMGVQMPNADRIAREGTLRTGFFPDMAVSNPCATAS